MRGTEYCVPYCCDNWLWLGAITTSVIDYRRTKNVYVGLKFSGLSESRTSGLVCRTEFVFITGFFGIRVNIIPVVCPGGGGWG